MGIDGVEEENNYCTRSNLNEGTRRIVTSQDQTKLV
jgi:hypothetical protein